MDEGELTARGIVVGESFQAGEFLNFCGFFCLWMFCVLMIGCFWIKVAHFKADKMVIMRKKIKIGRTETEI